MNHIALVRKARNVKEMAKAIDSIKNELTNQYKVLAPYLQRRSIVSISAAVRNRTPSLVAPATTPKATPGIRKSSTRPAAPSSKTNTKSVIVDDDPLEYLDEDEALEDLEIDEPVDNTLLDDDDLEDSNTITIQHTGETKVPRKQAITPSLTTSFKPPKLTDVKAHTDALETYHEQLPGLQAAETALTHHFVGLKGQALTLISLTKVIADAKNAINSGLNSLNVIADNSMPDEFMVLGEDIEKYVKSLLPKDSYTDIGHRTYVGNKEGKWIYTTYISVGGLKAEHGAVIEDFNIVITAVIESVAPAGKAGRPAKPKSMTLQQLIQYIGVESTPGFITIDGRNVIGKRIKLPFKGITAEGVSVLSLPATSMKDVRYKEVKYVLASLNLDFGKPINGWYTIKEKAPAIAKSPVVKEDDSNLRTIAYYVTSLMDFRLPGKFPLGHRVQDLTAFKKAVQILLRHADITTILDQRELGFDTEKAKKVFGKIPGIKAASVEGNTTLVLKLTKRSNFEECNEIAKRVIGLFNIHTGNVKRKSASIWTPLPDKEKATQLNFNLINSLKGEKTDITTPDHLRAIQTALDFSDEAMEHLKQGLLQIHHN